MMQEQSSPFTAEVFDIFDTATTEIINVGDEPTSD